MTLRQLLSKRKLEPKLDEQSTSRSLIIFVTDSFSVDSGGRTLSIFRRAKLFQSLGFQTRIATTNLKTDYADIYQQLCKKSDLSKTPFENPYAFLSEEPLYHAKSKNHPILKGLSFLGLDKVEYLDNKHAIGEKDNSRYDIALFGDGACHKVHQYAQGILPERKLLYDKFGHLIREQIVSTDSGSVIQTKLYTTSGRCFLIYCYDENEKITSITWIKRDGTAQIFQNQKELLNIWLQFLNNLADDVIFFAEVRTIDNALFLQPNRDRFKVIATIHSTIFNDGYGSSLRTYYAPLVNNINRYDAVVALTNEQKDDLRARVGFPDNLFVIPHPEPVHDVPSVERVPNRIVIVSRLVPLKRIDHAIMAMSKVTKIIPDAQLLIYGEGESRDYLQRVIHERNLEGSVRLMGFTDKPLDILSSAELSLSTSEYEGSSMSVTESLLCGTPVVSYRYSYGPKDLICNGENGFLVSNGNINELADKIVITLQDKNKLNKMSLCARSRCFEIKQSIIPAWQAVFAYINKNANQGARDSLAINFRIYALEILENTIEERNSGNCWYLRLIVRKSDNFPATYSLHFDSVELHDIFDVVFTSGSVINREEFYDEVEFMVTGDYESLILARNNKNNAIYALWGNILHVTRWSVEMVKTVHLILRMR